MRLIFAFFLAVGMLSPQMIIIAKKKAVGVGIAQVGTSVLANGDGVTSSAINTTGATLLVAVASSTANDTETPTDSSGNTWTALTQLTSSSYRIRIYYVCGPTTGATHTFTAHGAGSNPKIQVSAWSGTPTSGCYDSQESGFNNISLTIQPGAVTPSATGHLIITGLTVGTGATTATIDSGFTVMDTATGTFPSASHAYKIESTTGAINPTWTIAGGTDRILLARAAIFKAQ